MSSSGIGRRCSAIDAIDSRPPHKRGGGIVAVCRPWSRRSSGRCSRRSDRMVSFGGGDSNGFGPLIRLSSPAPPCGDTSPAIRGGCSALAVFAAHSETPSNKRHGITAPIPSPRRGATRACVHVSGRSGCTLRRAFSSTQIARTLGAWSFTSQRADRHHPTLQSAILSFARGANGALGQCRPKTDTADCHRLTGSCATVAVPPSSRRTRSRNSSASERT